MGVMCPLLAGAAAVAAADDVGAPATAGVRREISSAEKAAASAWERLMISSHNETIRRLLLGPFPFLLLLLLAADASGAPPSACVGITELRRRLRPPTAAAGVAAVAGVDTPQAAAAGARGPPRARKTPQTGRSIEGPAATTERGETPGFLLPLLLLLLLLQRDVLSCLKK